MDDDHCVITTQHRICEIPIAADKRQFSVFVNMSAAWCFAKQRCKYIQNPIVPPVFLLFLQLNFNPK